MKYRLLPIFIAGVFLVAVGISGCSDKLTCWPFCSSSTSSGVDNDTPTDTTTDPTVSLSCTPSSATEDGGTFTCTLSLSAATTKTVTVEIAYTGTATAGTDYTGNTTSHTISAGSTSTAWTLTGSQDSFADDDETIILDISSVTNATEKSGTQVEVLTLDNDASSLTSVIVIKPNGGEVFRYLNSTAGGTSLGRIRIRWGTGGSGTVIIDLYKSGKFHYRIHDNNDGYKQENEEYSWKPHPGLPSGTDYQIKVSAPNDSSVYDMSNSYFTISEPDD